MGIGSISLITGTAKAAIVFPSFRSMSYLWNWKQKATTLSLVEQFTAVIACCLPAFRVYLRNAKRRAKVWPKESEFIGGGGGDEGKAPSIGFRDPEAIELASFHSAGGILADRDQEIFPSRGSKG